MDDNSHKPLFTISLRDSLCCGSLRIEVYQIIIKYKCLISYLHIKIEGDINTVGQKQLLLDF